MVCCGIDVGAKNVKVVLMDKDGKILAKTLEPVGFEGREATMKALEKALMEAGKGIGDINNIVTTGVGRKDFFIDGVEHTEVTEVTSGARGAVFLIPSTRTVIDVGAEEGRAIKCDETGKVIDFAINEKCAAGAGAFTEAMARALEVDLEEFGLLSLKSERPVPMNAQCAVFAESEVVSLIHAKVPKQDISRAVHDAIASRIISMVRRVGVDRDVTLIGGVALNPGYVQSMKRGLDMEVKVAPSPEYAGAIGAGLIALDRAR